MELFLGDEEGASDKTACTNTSVRLFQTKIPTIMCFLAHIIFCLVDYDILKQLEGGFILILFPEKRCWHVLKIKHSVI